MTNIELSAIERAARVVGSQKALARLLGIQQPSVCRWIKTGHVPAERVLEVERVSGISRTALRPDIYPPEPPPFA